MENVSVVHAALSHDCDAKNKIGKNKTATSYRIKKENRQTAAGLLPWVVAARREGRSGLSGE
jgi:hypothetical protein